VTTKGETPVTCRRWVLPLVASAQVAPPFVETARVVGSVPGPVEAVEEETTQYQAVLTSSFRAVTQ